MAIKGVDTAEILKADVLASVKQQGYSFVGRYYSLAENGKLMTAAESDRIATAGLKRVVVYENLHNSVDKFSATIASRDAGDAIAQAKRLGQPSSTIYFAVDFNADEADVKGNIMEHFKVIKPMLASAGYSTGVYGSSLVCKLLKEAGLVSKTWRSMSTAWGHGATFSDYNIIQEKEITIGGIKFDTDTASSIYDIGAW